MNRLSWDEMWTKMVKACSERSPCHRLQVGCLLVKDNRLISQGHQLCSSLIVNCVESRLVLKGDDHQMPAGIGVAVED